MSQHAATISAIRYDATVTADVATPLGETATLTVPVNTVVVTLSVGDVTDHELHFHPPAIDDRMAGYGLRDERAAIEALVRELVFGWAPSLQPADPTNHIDVLGGVDERITVTWSKSAARQLGQVLASLNARAEAELT